MSFAPPANPLAFLQRATTLIVQQDSDNRDLSMRQLAILLHLSNRPEPAPSVKDLARRFSLNKPTVTRSIDRLTDSFGFVHRIPSRHDRRCVEIRISAAGADYVTGLLTSLGGAA